VSQKIIISCRKCTRTGSPTRKGVYTSLIGVRGRFFGGTPKSIFAETHLYTIEDGHGQKDTALETVFSALEGRADQIIEKIVAAARRDVRPGLSAKEKAEWDLFFYLQWKRVPDLHRKVASLQEGEAHLDELFAIMRARYPDRIDEIDGLDTAKERKRLLQGGKVKAIASIRHDVLAVLDNRGLAIVRIIAPCEYFAIGSLPIVRTAGDLRNPSAEVWLPVASDVAVGLGRAKGEEDLILVDDPQTVLAFNRATAAQSSSFAAVSKPLIEALTACVPTLHENPFFG
jgi:hypothetical protein